MPIIDYYVKLDKYLEQCANKETSYCKGQCVLMQKFQMLDNARHTEEPPMPATINMQDYPIAIIEAEETGSTFGLGEPMRYSSVSCILPKRLSEEIFHPPA